MVGASGRARHAATPSVLPTRSAWVVMPIFLYRSRDQGVGLALVSGRNGLGSRVLLVMLSPRPLNSRLLTIRLFQLTPTGWLENAAVAHLATTPWALLKQPDSQEQTSSFRSRLNRGWLARLTIAGVSHRIRRERGVLSIPEAPTRRES